MNIDLFTILFMLFWGMFLCSSASLVEIRASAPRSNASACIQAEHTGEKEDASRERKVELVYHVVDGVVERIWVDHIVEVLGYEAHAVLSPAHHRTRLHQPLGLDLRIKFTVGDVGRLARRGVEHPPRRTAPALRACFTTMLAPVACDADIVWTIFTFPSKLML